MDVRHKRRIGIVQELYAILMNQTQSISPTAQRILDHQKQLDQEIAQAAPKYVLAKIAKADRAILRLALYELLIEKKEPAKVIINEAIELAKELAGEKSPGFVNAVLGKTYEAILNHNS